MTVTPDFLARIGADRRAHRLPTAAREAADAFIDGALALLFPHFARGGAAEGGAVEAEYARLVAILHDFLRAQHVPDAHARAACDALGALLPEVRDALEHDADATLAADPAAKSRDEVILAYPGFLALAHHRLAHALHRQGVALLPRLVSEAAHRATGIDIHPGAQLGRGIAIDHGTGIVIGETTVIGDRVKLYQGVTLGALSVRKELARTKRHPTIEDDVVIYANATILGGETVVGRGSVIGGNVWLTHSVPARSIVTVETRQGKVMEELEFHI
ncbi:MAG: serine O-acetyltransferase EpsC [Gemmatimonadales bacterium]|nr:serine O-acetyltransferase EpsC [Gemmatimonadales bacterium]